jgi:hypothetical protein
MMKVISKMNFKHGSFPQYNFVAGETYEIEDAHAEVMIRAGYLKPADGKAKKEAPKEKVNPKSKEKTKPADGKEIDNPAK